MYYWGNLLRLRLKLLMKLLTEAKAETTNEVTY